MVEIVTYAGKAPSSPQGWAALILLGPIVGTVAKLAMRQPFVLFKGLTFQKTLLTRRISPRGSP
ncbi:hypothetical protein ABNIH5_19724 [Acinetobacter baumannii ABNIH5]|nr:hypothetical protein ABNIH5_19724 [Acinetobacter baumannii ABNIH5]